MSDGRRATAAGRVRLSLTCSPREGEGRGRCAGTVRINHRVGRRVTTLGVARFAADAGKTADVRLQMTATSPPRRRAVRVVVEAHDLAGNRGRVSFGSPPTR